MGSLSQQGLPPHPPQRTGPVLKTHRSASCLTGPVEGSWGGAEWGYLQLGAEGEEQGRQRPGHITGFEGQVMWAVLITHSHTLTHREEDPVLTRSLQVEGAPLTVKLCPWPGLRQVPTVTAAAVAVGSQVQRQLFTQVLSFCEEEEEEARGERGGRREGGRGDSRRREGGKMLKS